MEPVSSASVAAPPQPLHFAPESTGAGPSLGNGLMVAGVMLVVLVVLVIWLKRRVGTQGAAASVSARWSISQRLRLGSGSMATFVKSESGEWMVVESRGQVSIVNVSAPGTPEGES